MKVIADMGLLNRYLKAIDRVEIDKLKIEFKKDKARIYALFPAYTHLINAEIDISTEEYEKDISMVLDVKSLLKLIDNKTDYLLLDDERIISVKGNIKFAFRQLSEDIKEKELNLDFSNAVKIRIDSIEIADYLDGLKNEDLSIGIKNGKMEMVYGVDDGILARMEIPVSSDKEVSIIFNGEYIKKVLKVLGDVVSISIDNNMPIKIEHETDRSKFEFILAPRVVD